MALLTHVPDELFGRGIAPAQRAHGFEISLDTAEPRGGGAVGGRIEAREGRHDPHPITVVVSCAAAWLDLPPQLVGQKPFLRPETYWELRTRFPVWLDEEAWRGSVEVGDLATVNWLPFDLEVAAGLPRALEGTFVAFRYRVEARRSRTVGHDTASLPLIIGEPRDLPVIRVETTPIGSWRLLEKRSSAELDGSAGECAVRYEKRTASGGEPL